jgi:hypothetical protein
MPPLLQWKTSKYFILWVYVCRLRYPACNAHAPYCYLWPARLYNIFPHYLKKGTIFGQKKLHLTWPCVSVLSANLFEKFLTVRTNGRDIPKNVYWSSCEVFIIIFRFELNLNFLYRFPKKYSNIKFQGKSIQWEPSCSMRTDRETVTHDESNSHFSQFSKGA